MEKKTAIRMLLTKALEKMEEKAREMKIQGVAVANYLESGSDVDWIGEMSVVDLPFKRQDGWNLVAVAWSKAAECMEAEVDSGLGQHKLMVGETGYDGGAFEEYKGCKLAFAFSGATGEEDYQVAKHGIEEFKTLLDAYMECEAQ